MFKKYESLPCVVEAVQFTYFNMDQVFNSLTGQFAAGFEDDDPVIRITTIHGDVAVVRLDDWIIKDKTLGTYYPIKDDIMKEKYQILETYKPSTELKKRGTTLEGNTN